jgi:hypothetical protein
VDAKLWNIGIRVKDVRAEVDYFVRLGGHLRIHEELATPEGQFEYALVDFAGTRLFLTPKTVFEDRLPAPLADGLGQGASLGVRGIFWVAFFSGSTRAYAKPRPFNTSIASRAFSMAAAFAASTIAVERCDFSEDREGVFVAHSRGG